MTHFVGGDVDIDQRVELRVAITKGHAGAVPERVLVVGRIVHAHGELEGQRRDPQPSVVHVVDDAAEIVSVIQGRIGTIDFLEKILWAREREGGGTARAVIEVHGLHIAVVHDTGRTTLRYVQSRVIRTEFITSCFGVSTGTNGIGVIEAFPLLDDLTSECVDEKKGSRGIGAILLCKIVDGVDLAGRLAVSEVDHQRDRFTSEFPTRVGMLLALLGYSQRIICRKRNGGSLVCGSLDGSLRQRSVIQSLDDPTCSSDEAPAQARVNHETLTPDGHTPIDLLITCVGIATLIHIAPKLHQFVIRTQSQGSSKRIR